MNIGILGAGGIAHTVAGTLVQTDRIRVYAVGARSQERAQAFAAEFGCEKAYGSYEALVSDPEVELIYVATPHSHHYEHVKLCLAHGKHVLCEKAFTMNTAQAEELIALAKEKQLYLAEAIWTRYMPSRALIRQVMESGIIGKVNVLTANLGYPISFRKRIMDPALAGGALLDLGVYGLNFARMNFDGEPERIESSVRMSGTGVDENETITMFWPDGRMAVLVHGIYAQSDRKGVIYGENGYIVVHNTNNPQAVDVFDVNDRLLEHHPIPPQITGYEYEFYEAEDAIAQGLLEAPSMPLSETLYIMRQMDALRKSWGLVYPQEREA